MIESFFRSLEQHRVRYLLISGQAAVLYGASYFSEDIDLWIDPTEANTKAFQQALQGVGARYYKLSPRLDSAPLQRGHGLHFTIPEESDVFLDVMGRPPRVPSFTEAWVEAKTIPSAWGDLPTVGIRHLVALKMTQRLSDYPVIGRLVLRDVAEIPSPSREDYRWAVDHIFTLEDFAELLSRYPLVLGLLAPEGIEHAFALACQSGEPASTQLQDRLEDHLMRKLQGARQADRRYWADIIGELKEMRAAHLLAAVGEPV